MDSGALRVHLAHTPPPSDAAQAHRLIDSGTTMGKVVLIT